jgi:hypothetical protein
MRRKAGLIVIGLTVLGAAAAAGAAVRQSGDTLQLQAVLRRPTASAPLPNVACPAGAASTAVCYQLTATGNVRGLGAVSDRYLVMTDDSDPSCVRDSFGPDSITVAGKGEIDASITVSAACNGLPTGFTVTGGSGSYAGATGSGSFTPDLVIGGHVADDGGDDNTIDDDDIEYPWQTDSWAGTITVPGYTFDLAPPKISGSAARTVLLHGNATHTRVTYRVKAVDAVDGPVPVSCAPRPGTVFRLGRTRVVCTATDSSANTARATFIVTIRRTR